MQQKEQTSLIYKMMSAYIDLQMNIDSDGSGVPTVTEMRDWATENLPAGTRREAVGAALNRLHSVYWLKTA